MSSEVYMKKTVILIFISLATILLIPYLITIYMTGQISPAATIPYDGRVISIDKNNVTTSIDYNEYLLGIVARNLVSMEDSVYDNTEFLKLNCVLANTLLEHEFEKNNEINNDFLSQYFISDIELQKLWGDLYSERKSKLEEAFLQVKDLVIYNNGSIIRPFYHFISSGMTRASFDADTYPYLCCRNTNEDLEERGFLSVTELSKEEFMSHFNEYNLYAGDSLKSILQISSRDESGYVTEIQVGDLTMTGDEFTTMFNLNSSALSFIIKDDSIKIITKGIGHGYGISLYYALAMAESGSTYTDIINYFYENVEIKTYSIKNLLGGKHILKR